MKYYLEDILKMDKYQLNNLSKNEIIDICAMLINEAKLLKSINKQKIDSNFYQLNDLQNKLNQLEQTNKKLLDYKKNMFKKLNTPLNFKERLTGKLDLKKINKPD